jgi:hypothetical protein
MGRVYQDALEAIRQQEREWGAPNQPPATPKALERLKVTSLATLDYDVDPAYLHFLTLTDGLHFNGFVVFASSIVPIAGEPGLSIGGFVETNLQLRNSPVHRRLVAFGEAGDEFYALDLRRRKFAQLDHPSLDVLESFDSFDDMMAFMLARALAV